MTSADVEWLRHNRVRLALHHLRAGAGRPLLVLHGLGDRAPTVLPAWAAPWPGPIAALDLTGHGDSSRSRGGGYTAEVLMGDVDTALARVGPSSVVGFGLGAYIALLIAGGRPQLVRGAILADGPGLAGGATHPTSGTVARLVVDDGRGPDPWALLELSTDLRPPDYAATFARLALQLSGLDEPIVVCARARSAWLDAVVDEPGVVAGVTLDAALRRLAVQEG